MRLPLPLYLALRTLRHHLIVAAATVSGVAIGMMVVSAILIVDANTRDAALSAGQGPATIQKPEDRASGATAPKIRIRRSPIAPAISSVGFDRRNSAPDSGISLVPSQEGSDAGSLETGGGEEDYAAMRLAVRFASLLTFLVGAIIVFYTMRFSVAARSREFSLVLCLGESRGRVAGSLLWEAGILGVIGTALGLCLAVPAGSALLAAGISTTGQYPTRGFDLPWPELCAMSLISVVIALSGVIGPSIGWMSPGFYSRAL